MRVPIVALFLLGGCLDQGVLDIVTDTDADVAGGHTDLGAAETDDSDTVVPDDSDVDTVVPDDSDPDVDTVVPDDSDPDVDTVVPDDSDSDVDTVVPDDSDAGDSEVPLDSEVPDDTVVVPSDSDPGDTVVAPPDSDPGDTVVVVDSDTADTADSAVDTVVAPDSDTADSAVDTVVAPDSDTADSAADTVVPPRDDDGDGWPAPDDCDDADRDVHPGAPELCDGRRNDCDDDAWTPATEDGHVAFESAGGAWLDVTAQFPTTAGAGRVPYQPPGAGTLWLCAGTFHRRVLLVAGPSAVRGRAGAEVTVLDGDLGGTVVSAGGVALTVSGLTVRNGTTATTGGGILATGPSLRIEASRVEDCLAGSSGGGLAYVRSAVSTSDVVITDTTFARDTARVAGGGASFAVAAGTVTLTRVTFEDDDAIPSVATSVVSGGGLRVAGKATAVRLEEITVTGCTAGGAFATSAEGGGASVSSSGGTLDVIGARFAGNVATGNGPVSSTGHTGGGLAVSYARTHLEDVVFEDNVAGLGTSASPQRGNGGGLYLSLTPEVDIQGATFARNVAGDPGSNGMGGGVYALMTAVGPTAPKQALHLADATLQDNTASSGGGAYLRADVLRVERITASGNTISGSGGNAGAGLHLWSPDGTLVDATVEDNVATGHGGGVVLVGTHTVSGTTIRGNRGTHSVGLELSGATVVHLVDGTSIRENVASLQGAGIGMTTGGFVDCTSSPGARTEIVGNVAANYGGAVQFYGATFVAVDCDLGEPGTARDNVDPRGWEIRSPNGVVKNAFGDGATFTCDDVLGCR